MVAISEKSSAHLLDKPIVSFMCREALKGYLPGNLPEELREVIAQFIDEHNSVKFNRV
jgi:hypothetical protein